MTPRQQEFLHFIQKYSDENGYAPTVREIAKAMGVTGMGSVLDTLRRLEDGGQINRKSRKARGIEIAANPWEQIGKAALRVLDSIKSEDIDRKVRLLRAAAVFVAEWNAVKEEALARCHDCGAGDDNHHSHSCKTPDYFASPACGKCEHFNNATKCPMKYPPQEHGTACDIWSPDRKGQNDADN